MKINVVVLAVVAVVVLGVVYYLNHHKIEGQLTIKGDKGSKSHMSIKMDAPKENEDRD